MDGKGESLYGRSGGGKQSVRFAIVPTVFQVKDRNSISIAHSDLLLGATGG
jgi:hypothetical protein